MTLVLPIRVYVSQKYCFHFFGGRISNLRFFSFEPIILHSIPQNNVIWVYFVNYIQKTKYCYFLLNICKKCAFGYNFFVVPTPPPPPKKSKLCFSSLPCPVVSKGSLPMCLVSLKKLISWFFLYQQFFFSLYHVLASEKQPANL